jgi:hypothetical protein
MEVVPFFNTSLEISFGRIKEILVGLDRGLKVLYVHINAFNLEGHDVNVDLLQGGCTISCGG